MVGMDLSPWEGQLWAVFEPRLGYTQSAIWFRGVLLSGSTHRRRVPRCGLLAANRVISNDQDNQETGNDYDC